MGFCRCLRVWIQKVGWKVSSLSSPASGRVDAPTSSLVWAEFMSHPAATPSKPNSRSFLLLMAERSACYCHLYSHRLLPVSPTFPSQQQCGITHRSSSVVSPIAAAVWYHPLQGLCSITHCSSSVVSPFAGAVQYHPSQGLCSITHRRGCAVSPIAGPVYQPWLFVCFRFAPGDHVNL